MNPERINAARAHIRDVAIRTPLVQFENLWLKLECLQPFGSFKIRGAMHAVRSLTPAQKACGVWTASAGNMGQALALAARRTGLPCTVVVPETAPKTKLRGMEKLDAQVLRVPFDRWWRTVEERSYPRMDGTFIHPCDDDRMLEGNATIGAEIMEDLPDVDTVYVPWGGGGLACAIAEVVRATVWACEVETAAPLKASLAAGGPRPVERKESFVDGIGGAGVFPRLFEMAQ
jgi:threonine dehydratase